MTGIATVPVFGVSGLTTFWCRHHVGALRELGVISRPAKINVERARRFRRLHGPAGVSSPGCHHAQWVEENECR
jgi:hypothetical protein